ncbi:uncharacterized protein LOC113388484 [Ctenocephalides felis]|uniref:uncharacterized protein LOC113388484 n=1 Tax=Ctenocephalides felis TaxID=7515 RepID=UPI000E6E3437|nr:uncharacterized protein LOC113388484 [Ctenocephalides felis]
MVDVFATSSATAIVTNATSAVGAVGRSSRKRPRPRRQNTAPATSENETVFSHRRLSASDSNESQRYTEYSRVTATATADDDDGSDVIIRMSTSDDRQLTSGLSSEVTTPFTDATSFAGIALPPELLTEF